MCSVDWGLKGRTRVLCYGEDCLNCRWFLCPCFFVQSDASKETSTTTILILHRDPCKVSPGSVGHKAKKTKHTHLRNLSFRSLRKQSPTPTAKP